MTESNEGRRPRNILPPRKRGLECSAQPTTFAKAFKNAKAYFIQPMIVHATGEDDIKRAIAELSRSFKDIQLFEGNGVVYQGADLDDFIAGKHGGMESPTVYLVFPDVAAAAEASRLLEHTGQVEGFEGLPQRFLTLPSHELSNINLKLLAEGAGSIQLNPVLSRNALKCELAALSKADGMAR